MKVREKLNFVALFKTFWMPEQEEIPEMEAVLSSDELTDEQKREMRKTLNELKKMESSISNPIKTNKRKSNISKVNNKTPIIKIDERSAEKEDNGIERE